MTVRTTEERKKKIYRRTHRVHQSPRAEVKLACVINARGLLNPGRGYVHIYYIYMT